MPLLRYGSVNLCGTPPAFMIPDQRPSQLNRHYERSHMNTYGRPLRGFDGEEQDPADYVGAWNGGDMAVSQANADDDAVGNGIFDGYDSAPVQHAGAGIFASRYAEPGYLYRERLTQPGEIVNASTNATMAFRPGGGGWPTDMEQAYRPFDAEVPRRYPLKGLGADDAAPGLGTWAVAGLIVGAAVALVYGTLKVK